MTLPDMGDSIPATILRIVDLPLEEAPRRRSMSESTCSVMLRAAYSRRGTEEKRVLSKEDG
jgi:hypothetical protein